MKEMKKGRRREGRGEKGVKKHEQNKNEFKGTVPCNK